MASVSFVVGIDSPVELTGPSALSAGDQDIGAIWLWEMSLERDEKLYFMLEKGDGGIS